MTQRENFTNADHSMRSFMSIIKKGGGVGETTGNPSDFKLH